MYICAQVCTHTNTHLKMYAEKRGKWKHFKEMPYPKKKMLLKTSAL